MSVTIGSRDALLIVDVQRDFLPGGSLAVPQGDAVVPVLNRYVRIAQRRSLPVFASRDWHPANHCSFRQHGGIWPVHCVADTPGAAFAADLDLPASAVIIDKATQPEVEAYSAFSGTTLAALLRARRVERLLVGGLATDYCVLNTVRDALAAGFKVMLLKDAIRAVNVQPDDGARAEAEMLSLGAVAVVLEDFNA
jgi:nicotinamidase/pyrazinamidase